MKIIIINKMAGFQMDVKVFSVYQLLNQPSNQNPVNVYDTMSGLGSAFFWRGLSVELVLWCRGGIREERRL